jgi:ATP-dependent DNA ligase
VIELLRTTGAANDSLIRPCSLGSGGILYADRLGRLLGSRTRHPRASPGFVIPMAGETVTKLPEGPDWLYELKLDGSSYSVVVS